MEGGRFFKILKAFFLNHWGGLVLATGLIHIVIGGYLVSQRYLPLMYGDETMGTVVEKKPVRVSRKLISYRIVYQFKDLTGNTFKDEAPVAKEIFKRLHVGDAIKTTYFKLIPSVHFVEGGLSSGIGHILTIVGIGITMCGMLLFLVELRKVRDGEPGNILST